jgi:hypothetical protein
VARLCFSGLRPGERHDATLANVTCGAFLD